MKATEYIKTIVYNGHMINIGLDDNGQQYFLEYVDENKHLVEVGCGSYNTDYQYEIEHLFGFYTQCVAYGLGPCEQYFAHGYCHNCPYNQLRIVSKENDGHINGDDINDQQRISSKSY